MTSYVTVHLTEHEARLAVQVLQDALVRTDSDQPGFAALASARAAVNGALHRHGERTA